MGNSVIRRKTELGKQEITPPKKMAGNDGKHDHCQITLAKIYEGLKGMESDFNKKIETIKSEILAAVDGKLTSWKKGDDDK